ncbi:MAG: von Willebrand factor type A domain-containing protein [Fibrobacteria bacterium]|nr:von Willebrand factor type A domain-containing protein [Fibrobacteria bacterium]
MSKFTLQIYPIFILIICFFSGCIYMEHLESESAGVYTTDECENCGQTNNSDYYPGTEKYGDLTYNPFHLTSEDSLSTFAIDVDNGSYTLARKKLQQGLAPDPASIRVEEFLNYFEQDYPEPDNGPLAVYIDGAVSPFRDSLVLLRIGLKGKELVQEERKVWNFTFLVDVSGSMTSRLAMVKYSLNVLVDNMQEGDQISLCTYAGSVSTKIAPTTMDDKEIIKTAINNLSSGGGTAMSSGIQNAYNTNMLGFKQGGVNRVIVCSDGDANIGDTSQESIHALIANYIDSGITLSTIGYGQGNYNDQLMEQLADKGNGNYYYVDSQEEGKRLFTDELASTMQVIAKDVKLQIEFAAKSVLKYRLIGYKNQSIPDFDFVKEDTDAGELGAGHRVTALYELLLTENPGNRLGSISLHYKDPDTDATVPKEYLVQKEAINSDFSTSASRFRFCAGVAEFAELLRASPYATGTTLAELETIISESIDTGDAKDNELLDLVKIAKGIK